MTAASLPQYADPPLQLHSPSYSAIPRTHEYRLALNPRLRSNRPPRSFVKQTKNGNMSLRLLDQDDRANLPVYGLGGSVQGTVDINKPEGITSVEVLIEGILKLEEIAEGGTSTQRLFLGKNILWVKDRIQDAPCPRSMRFNFALPTSYADGEKTYSLPPSCEAHLSGLPGFTAKISYSVGAIVIKPNDVSNKVKSTILRKDDWMVSTPFLYLPRSRPSVPIPISLVASTSSGGFAEIPQWKLFSSSIASQQGMKDLVAKLYLPATRVFCVSEPIPFHLSFHSNAEAMAAFLPFAPVAGLLASKRQVTRIQLMRQTSVDVRNGIILGTKTDIWRVDCIGEGVFRNAGNGPDWAAFSGDIFISDEIKIAGFRAGGFSIRDCLVLTMTPPDLFKSPFRDLRMVLPIRLATDSWSEDGTGIGAYGPPSISSSEELAAAPELHFAT